MAKISFAQPCPLCPDGGAFVRPDHQLLLPGIPPGTTCQSLAEALPLFFTIDSPECQQNYALISALCGCNGTTTTPCRICNGDSENPTFITAPIEGAIEVMQFPNAVLAKFAAPLFDDLIPEPTCEVVQAFLLGFDQNSTECNLVRAQDASSACGCVSPIAENSVPTNSPSLQTSAPTEPIRNATKEPTITKCSLCHEGSAVYRTKVVEIPGFPSSTCQVLEIFTASLDATSQQCLDAQKLGVYCGCQRKPNSCQLCPDHAELFRPNQTLPLLAADYGGVIPTCDTYESIVANDVVENTVECSISRGLSTECGCPSAFEDHCEACPGGIPENMYDVRFEENKEIRCGVLETWQTQLSNDDWSCFYLQQNFHWCGCRGGVWNYAGAETTTQQAILAWGPRVTALLSLCGSIAILYEIWRGRRKRSHKQMYHQIMIAICVADIISSLMWMLSTLPIPKYNEYGIRLKIYGAIGNQSTCVAQGTFDKACSTRMYSRTHCFYVVQDFYLFLVVQRFGSTSH